MSGSRVGIIGNPLSHGNRSWRAQGLREVAARHEGAVLAEPHTRPALAEALAGFHEAGVRIVAISGGDGTLREVLTALPQVWPGPAPDLALLPAGKTDVAAGDVGAAGASAMGLARLMGAIERGDTLRRTERPVLEVRWPDQPERLLRGFLFGAAAFTEGHRLAERRLNKGGVFGATAVGLALGVTLLRAFAGGGDLARGQELALTADGSVLPAGRRFLLLATTLERLTLDLRPFREGGEGPVRWLDIPAPPRRLRQALRSALRPFPGDVAQLEAAGHRSGRAKALRVETAIPFIFDGERYNSGSHGVELSAPARQGFVAP